MRTVLWGFVLGVPGLIAGCGGDDDDADVSLADGCDITEVRCQRAIFDATAEVRGQTGTSMPRVRTISVQEFAESLEPDDSSSDEPNVWSSVLPLLRLLPEGSSIARESAEVAVSEVAAFYDTETKQVTVLDRGPSEPLENLFLLSHEFVHALQDSELNLEAFRKTWVSSLDSLVAITTLVEGEATVLGLGVVERAISPSRVVKWDEVRMSVRARFFERVGPSRAPLLAAVQLAPYAFGMEQLVSIWRQRGQIAIDELYQIPRLSLLDWAEDTQVTRASRLQALECFPTAGPPGFTGYDTDSFGPLGILATALQRGNTAQHAWAGALHFRGDRAVVFTEPASPGSYAIAWRVRFDTAGAATAFANTLSQSLVLGSAVATQEREVVYYGTTLPDRLSAWTQPTHCGTEADLPAPREEPSPGEEALRQFEF
jgi:hypothetical protein